ncbi:uncharacterized protein [Argopecten irradians]|uniref:uncharacterized protein isoform X2 n=1 Tax=Argopecten irradians TaxID=31199 RepID=UPI00371899C3
MWAITRGDMIEDNSVSGVTETQRVSEPSLSELFEAINNSQKAFQSQISELRTEISANSSVKDIEFKTLKEGSELTWQRNGNKDQHKFNSDILDIIKQTLWGLENGKPEYCEELLTKVKEDIEERNRHIRLADHSEFGWDTVKHYMSDPMAKNSEDLKKIYKAESDAKKEKGKKEQLSKRQQRRSGYVRPAPYPSFTVGAPPSGNNMANVPAGVFGGGNQLFRDPREFWSYRSETCFGCRQPGHFRRECPAIVGQDGKNNPHSK